MVAQRKIGRRGAAGDLTDELEALPDLSPDTLKQRWSDLYGAPPPLRLSRTLMIRAIAHRLQEQALGGLPVAARRRLARAGEDIAAGRTPSQPRATIKPGTRLLRQWQGVTHEVIVLEDGVVQFRGESWGSLSAVARAITGTRWSGPRFFGLNGHRDERR